MARGGERRLQLEERLQSETALHAVRRCRVGRVLLTPLEDQVVNCTFHLASYQPQRDVPQRGCRRTLIRWLLIYRVWRCRAVRLEVCVVASETRVRLGSIACSMARPSASAPFSTRTVKEWSRELAHEDLYQSLIVRCDWGLVHPR